MTPLRGEVWVNNYITYLRAKWTGVELDARLRIMELEQQQPKTPQEFEARELEIQGILETLKHG